MTPDQEDISKILLNGQQALQRGERLAARRWAEKAIELAPDSEESWLLMAAVASPHASINYLNQALKINPGSLRAQKGMQWAMDRLHEEHHEIDASLRLVHLAGDVPRARLLLRTAIATSRKHFAFEEQSVFPLIESSLLPETLAGLASTWSRYFEEQPAAG